MDGTEKNLTEAASIDGSSGSRREDALDGSCWIWKNCLMWKMYDGCFSHSKSLQDGSSLSRQSWKLVLIVLIRLNQIKR